MAYNSARPKVIINYLPFIEGLVLFLGAFHEVYSIKVRLWLWNECVSFDYLIKSVDPLVVFLQASHLLLEECNLTL
jgi:hypothetical protein